MLHLKNKNVNVSINGYPTSSWDFATPVSPNDVVVLTYSYSTIISTKNISFQFKIKDFAGCGGYHDGGKIYDLFIYVKPDLIVRINDHYEFPLHIKKNETDFKKIQTAIKIER